MSDYTRVTDFAALAGLDALPDIFNTEFNLVANASATKADLLNPTFSGTVVVPILGTTTSDAGKTGKTSPPTSGEIYMHTFESNVKTTFFQSTAPLGWTQDTTHSDSLLRVVQTAGGGSGGSTGFVGAPLNITDSHVLTISEIPSHTHTVNGTIFGPGYLGGATSAIAGNVTTSATGGGGGHTHTITWTPKYINIIVCTKQ